MSKSDSTFQKKKKKQVRLLPKRGQVKAKMFEILCKTVFSAFSKSEESHKRSGGEGGGDGRSSTSVTSTPSGYSTDANGGNS
ncbi:hypothetical protein SLEP1_g13695 [Rubroshorea leprosula]|uniref:Uncharacterized protein n=1 Tax=Rubroshorea leprosula TaxID=152421 RepID=A0AAV5IGS5_9ROSI|nr:hypothetical protein SLEP1_g13695 [Rubroshorea leprosula]